MTFKADDLQFTTYDYDKTARIYGIYYSATTVSEDENLRVIKFPQYLNYRGTRYKVDGINCSFSLYDKLKKVIAPKAAGYVSVPYGVEVEYY